MVGSGDKTAVVTGAGRGLGAVLSLSLAEAGYRIVLCGRNAAALVETAAKIEAASGHRPALIDLDLADMDSVGRAVESISATNDCIDLVINNGAMWLAADDKPYMPADVYAVVNSAVSGTFLLTQGLLPLLGRSARPDIVTIGSVSGLPNALVDGASVPFYAAKRAQAALADGLRQTLIRSPIRSIIVYPPDLDDVDQSECADAVSRQKGALATNRDVVDAVLFAITRPRNISLSITIDTDGDSSFAT